MGFLYEFLSNPKKTGAIVSSSKYLSDLICESSNIDKSNCVVELGPGRGSFTREILKRVGEEARYFSIEINPRFYSYLREENPGLELYLDGAQNLKKYLKEGEEVDSVISGLPFASFEGKLQSEIIDSVYDSLRVGGEFLTFAYLQGLLMPGGRRFNSVLNNKFLEVKRTRIEWRNIPPAFVYHCLK